MTYTEAQVRNEASAELANSNTGSLTTSQLIKRLEGRLTITGKDADIANNRGDTYFSQKVKNLVSHLDGGLSLETQGLAIYDADGDGWTITDQGREKATS
jgi:hypothetical protein